jgi:hypothetical protein
VRIFKNTWFTRFADKEGIKDSELRGLADQLEAGQADANFGVLSWENNITAKRLWFATNRLKIYLK